MRTKTRQGVVQRKCFDQSPTFKTSSHNKHKDVPIDAILVTLKKELLCISSMGLNFPLAKVEIRKCTGIGITSRKITWKISQLNIISIMNKEEKVVSIGRMCPVVNMNESPT